MKEKSYDLSEWFFTASDEQRAEFLEMFGPVLSEAGFTGADIATHGLSITLRARTEGLERGLKADDE